MKRTSYEQELTLSEVNSNRRQAPRISRQFRMIFSGMDEGQFLMGDGDAFDLSQEEIEIHTHQSVKPGMELALFLDLSDSEDHLCIPEARVSWVNEQHFGVALRTLKLEDQERLRNFLRTH